MILLPICSQAQIIAIRAGRVADPQTGKTTSNQIILVEKGKITAIGMPLRIPAGAMVIDLSRFTVLPGLFDAHTDRGELRVGLAADIIATLENPLEHANALKRVTFVMKDGVVIKRGE